LLGSEREDTCMKRRNMQMVFDAMSKTAREKYPEKESVKEQFKAYGKIGLLIYCKSAVTDTTSIWMY
jgi:hypothetical protein